MKKASLAFDPSEIDNLITQAETEEGRLALHNIRAAKIQAQVLARHNSEPTRRGF